MNIINTELAGLVIIEPRIFNDQRGYFFESFNQKEFTNKSLISNYIQDNQSKSCYGVIRGLHYQLEPFAQTKLVRVLQGKIYDVALDIRISSPTFGKWFGIELSCENKKQLYIPKGFAHGFSVMSETAIVLYKCDCLYNPSSERGINISDDKLNIDWKINKELSIVSDKDKNNPDLSQAEYNFNFEL